MGSHPIGGGQALRRHVYKVSQVPARGRQRARAAWQLPGTIAASRGGHHRNPAHRNGQQPTGASSRRARCQADR